MTFSRPIFYWTKSSSIVRTIWKSSPRVYRGYHSVNDASTTHFGFQTIASQEKEKLVGNVFHGVASNYDFMNDAMSLGIHRCWKDTLIKILSPQSDTKLLDVAGGTGDIAFRFLNHLSSHWPQNAISGHVTVLDINSSMLKVGESKSLSHLNDFQRSLISWQEGNAEELNCIPSSSMDAYTIAFGIRNCTHIDKVIQEAYRVLKVGGRFLCLEFSHVQDPLFKMVYDGYSFNVIPLIGQIIANNKPAYQYLVESIRKFPTQEAFVSLIEQAGFRQVSYQNLLGGIAAIHSGVKI